MLSVATKREDGTPLYRGVPVRDCTAEMLEKFKRYPKKLLGLDDFRPLSAPQALWAFAMLVERREIIRVTPNAYQLNVPEGLQSVATTKARSEQLFDSLIERGEKITPPKHKFAKTGITERVFDALKAYGDPMSNQDLMLMLNEDYTVINNAVTALVSKGRITKTKRLGLPRGAGSVVYHLPVVVSSYEAPQAEMITPVKQTGNPLVDQLRERLTGIMREQDAIDAQIHELQQRRTPLMREGSSIQQLLEVYEKSAKK